MIKSAETQRPYPLGHGGRQKRNYNSSTALERSIIHYQGVYIYIEFNQKGTGRYSEEDFTVFRDSLSDLKRTSLWEAGLDYSTHPSIWRQQHKALNRILD